MNPLCISWASFGLFFQSLMSLDLSIPIVREGGFGPERVRSREIPHFWMKMVALASPSASTYYRAWSRNLGAAALPLHSGCRAAFVRVSAGRNCCRKRMSSVSAATEEKASDAGDVTVQYVVLRRDLIDTWPLGSVVTQGCHASVAAIWSHRDDPVTVEYCSPSNLDSMHKVTLQVKGEPQIINLSEKLKAGGIDHKLWVEQPENVPTCLATKPYPKSVVSSYFKKLQLCK